MFLMLIRILNKNCKQHNYTQKLVTVAISVQLSVRQFELTTVCER